MCVCVFFFFFASIMGQPFMPLPSFSNFAKISSNFFQRAMSSSIKSLEESEGQEDRPPMMAEAMTQIQEEVSPWKTGILPFALFLSLSFPFLVPFPAF